MRSRLNKFGQFGIILDQDDIELPPNAWTNGNNVRFENGVVKSGFGYSGVTITSAADKIMRAMFMRTTIADYWVYAADTDDDGVADSIFYYDGSTETELTGWDTTNAGADDVVNIGQLHGYAVITNGSDPPVYWDGQAATVSYLPWNASYNWDDYDGNASPYYAYAIRPYKQFLIAMNIVDDGFHSPRMVHWSNITTPGQLPTSWVLDDPSEESGRTEFAETSGWIVDGLELRDQFIIYKEDAIYSAQFVGGSLVYTFQGVAKDRGLIAPNCVVEVSGKHFVFGQRSIYWFDGTSMVDVAEGRVRDYLFDVLDQDRRYLCHLAHNIDDNEIWICYPTAGSTGCERALVYNYVSDTFAPRDLPQSRCHFLSSDLNNPTVRIDDDLAWKLNDDTEIRILDLNYVALATQLVSGSDKFYLMDDGNTADGTNQRVYVRRTELELGELDDYHMIRSIRPRATGAPFTIKIGRQSVQDGDVTWEFSDTFMPGTDYKLDCRVTGRLHALELTSTENVHWECGGIDIDYEIVGRR